jgi:OOP family OmpA-OmpF porin
MAACAIALLGIGTIAAAADTQPADGLKSGFYLGVDAGWIGYHEDVDGVSVDLSGFAYGVLGGYQFNKYVALEASYLGNGTASTNVSGFELDYKTHGVQAALIGSLPLSPSAGLYGRLGLVRWDSTASVPALGVSESDSGTDGLYGLGAYVTNSQDLTGRLEVTTTSINGVRIYRVTLGGYWTF